MFGTHKIVKIVENWEEKKKNNTKASEETMYQYHAW